MVFRCITETKHIIFHSKFLTLDQTSMNLSLVSRGKRYSSRDSGNFKSKGDNPCILQIKSNDTYEMVTLSLSRRLHPGYIYKLWIQYSGKMATAAAGRGLYWAVNKNT